MFTGICFLQEIIEVSKMKKEYKGKLTITYMSNNRLIIRIIIGGVLIRRRMVWSLASKDMMVMVRFRPSSFKIKVS